ncbi:hypothetical protein [Streptomyces lasiicapitis]|uniref:hypothetical protein n=1 Tax=Streptomyces lasiicapitis TaxID=1923961 RepID=UPI00369F4D16
MDAVRFVQCLSCGEQLEQRGGPGRRKEYCNRSCRRRAQRRREREALSRPSARFGAGAAERLQALTNQLVELGSRDAPLDQVLGGAVEVSAAVQRYIAAVVHDAREDGQDWDAIARAAGVSASSARSVWSQSRLDELLVSRSAPPYLGSPPLGPGRAGRGGPGGLASALACLHTSSRASIAEIAGGCGLTAEELGWVLSGELAPPWPVVRKLAVLLGARPEELYGLWLTANECTCTTAWPSLQTAAHHLRDHLRGLYLAAGRPSLRQLQWPSATTALEVRAVLEGRRVPGWAATAGIAQGLGASTTSVRAVWQEVHYALLTSPDPLPLTGKSTQAPGATTASGFLIHL